MYQGATCTGAELAWGHSRCPSATDQTEGEEVSRKASKSGGDVYSENVSDVHRAVSIWVHVSKILQKVGNTASHQANTHPLAKAHL